MRSRSIAGTLTLIALLGGGIVALGALYAVDPAGSAWYPKCPFHSLTGLHCPGCGGLRGAHQLLQGNVVAAVRMNALVFVVGPPLLVTWAVNRYRRAHHRSAIDAAAPALLPIWAWWTLLAVVVVFFIARNVPYEPFVLLAPG